jgi:type 1 fimbriae regulatory protein FimB/type 1 fimbriae regulatory protein FimE
MKYWKPNELLNVLSEARKVSHRNHLLVLLAYKHGLRSSEVCALRLRDIAHGRLDCQRLKGSLHTNRPLESDPNILLDEKRALASYMVERGDVDTDVLFVSRLGKGMTRRAVYDIFEDATAAAGIEPGRRNPHCAKHTLGALLYRAGVDTFALQQLLGHRDAKATAIYAGVTQDEAHSKALSAASAIFA